LLYLDYMQQMRTLNELKLGHSGNYALGMIFLMVLLVLVGAWVTPWMQTAQGWGYVTTANPANRIQAISALVPGQIHQWHVREGEQVKKGQAIVTLIDQDPLLLGRLEAELNALKQQKESQRIAMEAAEKEYTRQQTLAEQGLSSLRQRDQAQIKLQEAKTKLSSLDAELMQTNTVIARQSKQTKYAPEDGVVNRLLSGGDATSVKIGDVLAMFIPDDVDRSVVIEVNGINAPLVQAGRQVRLQFEGWPVFQFSGWPSSAIGTFGGIVDFVEPVANANGYFNIWVTPDLDDKPWPDADFVRLGSKAKGWVILEEVKLGYEVWRQLNNFPPKYRQRPEGTETK